MIFLSQISSFEIQSLPRSFAFVYYYYVVVVVRAAQLFRRSNVPVYEEEDEEKKDWIKSAVGNEKNKV